MVKVIGLCKSFLTASLKFKNMQRIVIGCNYHTKWQKNKSMRFVLAEVKGDKARLQTRNTGKNFWTNLSDLIFIETDYNKRKADTLSAPTSNIPDWVNSLL